MNLSDAAAVEDWTRGNAFCCPLCGWHLSSHGSSHGRFSDCPNGMSPSAHDGTLVRVHLALGDRAGLLQLKAEQVAAYDQPMATPGQPFVRVDAAGADEANHGRPGHRALHLSVTDRGDVELDACSLCYPGAAEQVAEYLERIAGRVRREF